jgi:hypothetical protein
MMGRRGTLSEEERAGGDELAEAHAPEMTEDTLGLFGQTTEPQGLKPHFFGL